jgi:hypothetical protein
MAAPTIQPGQIKTGPGRILWAPLGTAIPTFTAAANKVTATWTSWVEAGATDAGMTFNTSVDSSPIKVAETPYNIRSVVTGKAGTVAFAMNHVSDVNWKLAENGGTITITGTGATKLSVFVPPLIGAEVRVMLGFLSLDEDEAFIWPQVFNTGGLETERGAIDGKHGIPVSFDVEMPDPAVLTTPYKRITSGSLAQSA